MQKSQRPHIIAKTNGTKKKMIQKKYYRLIVIVMININIDIAKTKTFQYNFNP